MNVFMTDGIDTKNITLPQFPNEAWTFNSNAPTTPDYELYCSVAAAFRAVNLTADATAGLPFAVMDSAGNDIDTSNDWQNVVGFMPNPRELIRLWRMSLTFTNSAYGFRETRDGEDTLRYIVPTTIEPEVDKWIGLIGFWRTIGGNRKLWLLEDERIFWMWRRDHSTELLPAEGTEFKAMMTAAGILYSADKFVQRFFDSGGVKPHLLMVKGVPSQSTKDDIEKWWTKVITFGGKYLGKAVNADQLEAVPIGEGIEGFEDEAIYKNKVADISMAMGIPLSLLLANSANRATAFAEYRNWYDNSLGPWADFMAEWMNVLLFKPLGYSFEFRMDATDPEQTEEHARSISYKRYVDAGMDPSLAAQVVGIELPKGYKYEDLDGQRDDNAEFAVGVEDGEDGGDEKSIDIEAITTEPVLSQYIPTSEQMRELVWWQNKVFRQHKAGQVLTFEFENRTLPDDVAAAIRLRLAEVETEEDIKSAFDLDAMQTNEAAEIIRLANAMNNLASAVVQEEKGDG